MSTAINNKHSPVHKRVWIKRKWNRTKHKLKSYELLEKDKRRWKLSWCEWENGYLFVHSLQVNNVNENNSVSYLNGRNINVQKKCISFISNYVSDSKVYTFISFAASFVKWSISFRWPLDHHSFHSVKIFILIDTSNHSTSTEFQSFLHHLRAVCVCAQNPFNDRITMCVFLQRLFDFISFLIWSINGAQIPKSTNRIASNEAHTLSAMLDG